MDAVLGVRWAALVAGTGAIATAWLQEWPAAAVLATIAVALPLAAVRPPEPRRGAASLRPLAELVGGLGLRGAGHHVPVTDRIRLFIPADPRATRLPDLEAQAVLHRSTPHALGVALTPLGSELEQMWSSIEALPAGGGTPAAAAAIKRSLEGLGLAQDIHVDAAGDNLRVRFQHVLLGAPCLESRGLGSHAQVGCPVCSLVAGLVARAHGHPVRFGAAEETADGFSLHLEVLGS